MIKRLVLIGVLASGLFSMLVLADARSDLQQRLSKVNSFHAIFSQSVAAADGSKVQEGRGELWIQRPNLFRWHTTTPDESLLISDGKTLWFYNPFVEQVTANWLDSATSDTPFILIARNNPSDWLRYKIRQQGDNFKLVPTSSKGNLKQFDLTVNKEGIIKEFTAVEQDGQRNSYILYNPQTGAIPASQFQFILPKGVTLDDQRQK